MSRLSAVIAAVGVLIVAVVVAGCADAPVTASPGTTAGIASRTASSTPPAPAAARTPDAQHAADIAYARMMLPHVRQGMELTAMVPTRAADLDLARLVVLMDNADVEEEGELVGQLHLWHATVPGENGAPSMMMPGMADPATLERLRALQGPGFDRAWLAVMIAHHQGGIDMSRSYLEQSSVPALDGVARAQVEIGGHQRDQMRALQERG